jgi:hypothetical protein
MTLIGGAIGFGQSIALIVNAIGGSVGIGGGRITLGVPDMEIIIFISNRGIHRFMRLARRPRARREITGHFPKFNDRCPIPAEVLAMDRISTEAGRT